MKHLKTVADVWHYRDSISSKLVGFVPTMGALHEGHMSLIKQCQKECEVTIVSIFVNPAQFGKSEDLDTYPRPLEKDLKLLEDAGVNAVFLPTTDVIYPSGIENTTQIMVPGLSSLYCGVTRPHFFQGVTTVVSRLMHIIFPHFAFFGEKDFQQLVILKKMCEDLFIPVQIKAVPIVREHSGLALSSRNTYLSEENKELAARIYKALKAGKELFDDGVSSSIQLLEQVRMYLEQAPEIEIDYIALVDPNTLAPHPEAKTEDRILIAAYIQNTRLIDNIEL